MKTILFVDDEPNVLKGLQRMLFPLRREYQMAFVSSGQQALDTLAKGHFDVVVSDMRMPGMDGAQLLAEVKKRHPDTLRFVLTGQSDDETVFRSVRDAHQFLSKPCKPKLLKECVDRAVALRDLLASDALKGVIAQIGSLPPMPQTYEALCKELESPEGSIANVGLILEEDVAMTAKVLQLVNSAFFSLRQRATTAAQAASLLGFETIKALVLTTSLFSSAEEKGLPNGYSVDRLWQHSMNVGRTARAIGAKEEGSREFCSACYTAGLLHDSGQLVLASSCPQDFLHALDFAEVNEASLPEAEKEVFGCSHAEVGAYLLGIWGLPSEIVEAVAYHHRPGALPGRELSPLAVVHVADSLVRVREKGLALYPPLDGEYLAAIGFAERLPEWEAACADLDEEKM